MPATSRRPEPGALPCVILTLILAAGSAHAQQPNLGLDDLTESQRRDLWERVDRYAGYAALLHLCGIDTKFDSRFVAAVQPCIEPATIKKVSAYYRTIYGRTLKTANQKPCEDPYFVRTNLAERLRATLEDQIAAAARLCNTFRK